MSKQKLSQEDLNRIMEIPAIELPLKFDNGTAIQSLTMSCSTCGRDIDHPEHIRVNIHRANPYSASVTGHLLCHGCKIVSPVNLRLSDDGTITCQTIDGWRTIRAQKRSGWMKFAWELRKLLWKSS